MDDLKFLRENLRVKAPHDFEEKLWQLYLERKEKKQKIKRLTFIFSGSLATAVAGLLVIVFLIVPSREASSVASSSKLTTDSPRWSVSYEEAIPITEPVLYTHEFTPESREKTIYILEPINDTPGRPIKY